MEQAILKHLSPAHALFVAEYIANGSNGYKAYLRAYPEATKKTAEVNSSRLLRHKGVSTALRKYAESLQELTKTNIEKGFRWALAEAKRARDYKGFSSILMDACKFKGYLVDRHELSAAVPQNRLDTIRRLAIDEALSARLGNNPSKFALSVNCDASQADEKVVDGCLVDKEEDKGSGQVTS